MKKAEEYALEWSLNNNNDQIDKQDFIAAVKQIQEEAIREAVKECKNLSKMKYEAGETGYLDIESVTLLKEKLISNL